MKFKKRFESLQRWYVFSVEKLYSYWETKTKMKWVKKSINLVTSWGELLSLLNQWKFNQVSDVTALQKGPVEYRIVRASPHWKLTVSQTLFWPLCQCPLNNRREVLLPPITEIKKQQTNKNKIKQNLDSTGQWLIRSTSTCVY